MRPCYQKKQKVGVCSSLVEQSANKKKCDHQYPCHNCVRRRLSERCSYSHASQNVSKPKPHAWSDSECQPIQQEESLSQSFSYFKGSKSNLLQLMEQHNLVNDDPDDSITDENIPPKLMPELVTCFRLYPKCAHLNPLFELFFSRCQLDVRDAASSSVPQSL
jgi:hypothetical protein